LPIGARMVWFEAWNHIDLWGLYLGPKIGLTIGDFWSFSWGAIWRGVVYEVEYLICHDGVVLEKCILVMLACTNRWLLFTNQVVKL
jgi:hypothetical protein